MEVIMQTAVNEITQQNIDKIKSFLKDYDGKEIKIMEVCGSHTAAISHLGIRQMISPKIHLVSGPGCPVCVTPSAYVDRLIELAKTPGMCVVTFGDLIRVPGSHSSLSVAKGEGAQVKMVYSPLDIIELAEQNKEVTFIFAAVGFETTTPIYTILMDTIIQKKIENIRVLTALKTMPEAIDWLCGKGAPVDGFIAPGHVSVITGSKVFEPLAEKYHIPFGVAGFKGYEILVAIYGIIKNLNRGIVKNYYPSAVTEQGNAIAKNKVYQYFEPYDASWRGMGQIKNSGLVLRNEYSKYDMGSRVLVEDMKINKGCSCDKVLMGMIESKDCPLFGKVCTPLNPQGACMVSSEGSCYQHYIN